ncbi:MAG: 3-oxoacyl-ACP synthase III [Deltaproteobacteria bacterium]|jgi:3-oxoacyl-[acyl-carrier-protein] synthase-3|nr:3-oxoacyl-ACP synthase III [Deltaproteobacteria bacterium]
MRVEPRFKNTALVAWARDEGFDRLSSDSLEEALGPLLERLRLPKGFIASMTGILARPLYPADFPPSQGAIRASKKLFDSFDPHQIDLLYSTSVGRDYLEPSTASIIQAALGLGPMVKSLDLGSACLGFIDGLELAALKIEAGLAQYALVTAGENSRPLLENTLTGLLEPGVTVREFFKNFASLTLGSGGAAMIVGPADLHPQAPKLISMVSLSDAANNHLCRGDFSGMQTDSAALLEAGVALAQATFTKGASNFGWTKDTFDLIVCHQVSEANTRRFSQVLELDWDRLIKTYPHYGNMGPVAVPFTFDLAWERGLIRPGHRVGLMGIGSGLCCAMMEVLIPGPF